MWRGGAGGGAENDRVEGGAVYKAITKITDATSVCVSCSYCLAIYTYCLKAVCNEYS